MGYSRRRHENKGACVNALQNETSPYLLQHADNPVEWYPWGEEALAKAAQENKPILLSIGYSACHWCHVMAHESFEDPGTADVMNRLFVNIKVDREERPDLDKIYQMAHQLIAQRPGGWPLTMFLTPGDHLPFFGGTYFPNESRYNMPAFTDLLLQVAQFFETKQDDIRQQCAAVAKALKSIDRVQPDHGQTLDRQPLDSLREQLQESFDPEWGGFGAAPKFPQATSLESLLRHWRSTAHEEKPDVNALLIPALTLTRMLEGGVYDQIGGGFYRYSVDREWQIPHFEKMLYDNGPLLALLAQLWLASADEAFRRAANETADWVLRDMRSPEGGFYATLDADSEGEEGRFYVWTADEVRKHLTDEEYSILAPYYGLDEAANFEGRWHLVIRRPLDSVAEAADMRASSVRNVLDSGRQALLEQRSRRVWPGRDEKILTGWNALLVRGLAIASRTLQREDLVDAADSAVEFIRDKLVDDDRLLATYKDGRAQFNGYLDDYAFLLDALLELLQVRWNSSQLEFATWIAERLIDNFEDKEQGGFFFTPREHEDLVYRPKALGDDATPSGNGIAVLALGRIGHLLGETRYLDAAERTLRAAWKPMQDHPRAHASLITALEEYLYPPEIIVIRGSADDMVAWAGAVGAIYAPRRLVFSIPADAEDLPGALALRKSSGSTIAYVCRGMSCSPPVTSLGDLAAEISEARD